MHATLMVDGIMGTWQPCRALEDAVCALFLAAVPHTPGEPSHVCACRMCLCVYVCVRVVRVHAHVHVHVHVHAHACTK